MDIIYISKKIYLGKLKILEDHKVIYKTRSLFRIIETRKTHKLKENNEITKQFTI